MVITKGGRGGRELFLVKGETVGFTGVMRSPTEWLKVLMHTHVQTIYPFLFSPFIKTKELIIYF